MCCRREAGRGWEVYTKTLFRPHVHQGPAAVGRVDPSQSKYHLNMKNIGCWYLSFQANIRPTCDWRTQSSSYNDGVLYFVTQSSSYILWHNHQVKLKWGVLYFVRRNPQSVMRVLDFGNTIPELLWGISDFVTQASSYNFGSTLFLVLECISLFFGWGGF